MRKLAERFLSWFAHLDPGRREITTAGLFLILLMAAGTIGYRLIEGWSWMDGLFMTFITLTTIGFREVHTLTTAGRIFTICIGIIGIGSVAVIATRTAQIILANERVRERHMNRVIERLENHYILCGYGRVGKRIAQDLRRGEKPFVVIDRNKEEAESLEQEQMLYVLGDAEEEDVLQRAGIQRARGLILTLPDDSANVFVTLMARELNPDFFILARANTPRNYRKLLNAGADKVLNPDEIGADRMAQVILRPNVDLFMEQVLRTSGLGLQMEEVKVVPGAPLAGKSLTQSNFRQQFDAIVVAVIEGQDGKMKFNPSAHTVIHASDILIVLGSQDMIERLRNKGCRP